MKMKTLLLGVGLGALVSFGALTTTAQTTNQNQAAAAKSNALALRQYEWKMRTEVQRKGETKSVQVAAVRFDSNGQKQTTVISKTPEPDLPKFGLRKAIAEKKFKEFKETIQQLGDLARAYGELSPEQMQKFMATFLRDETESTQFRKIKGPIPVGLDRLGHRRGAADQQQHSTG